MLNTQHMQCLVVWIIHSWNIWEKALYPCMKSNFNAWTFINVIMQIEKCHSLFVINYDIFMHEMELWLKCWRNKVLCGKKNVYIIDICMNYFFLSHIYFLENLPLIQVHFTSCWKWKFYRSGQEDNANVKSDA